MELEVDDLIGAAWGETERLVQHNGYRGPFG